MIEKWAVREFNVSEQVKIDTKVHPHPVLDAVFKQRGIKTIKDLELNMANILDPYLMKGMEGATDLLLKHINKDSKIIVIGDFDCDGATATTIAISGLKMLGAKNISFLIPDRKEHGYGLTEQIVEVAGKSKPDLIVTVDNGITSIDGVNAVHALGHPCEILITDHHLPSGDKLPSAEGIVNPNQPECEFPSKALAGCGVMFYVVVALRSKMRKLGYFEKANNKEPSLAPLLDVLALGSVADLVPLDYNNRILIKAGLDRINQGRGRPGIAALAKARGREIGKIVCSDIGFSIAPCINATGRISDGSLAVRLLTASHEEAEDLALLLVDLNEQRKSIQKDMTEDAMAFVESTEVGEKFAITLFLEDAHEGVVGIVAGRIKDSSNRPVVCLGLSKDPNILKGSARSRHPVNIRHAFDKVASIDPDIFVGYGGHAMAAGLAIHKNKLEEFERLFNEVVSEDLTKEMIKGDINVDMILPPEYLSIETAEAIRENGPWGMKFEEPVFGGKFIVKDYIVRKEVHLSLTLENPETGAVVQGINFFGVENGEVPVQKGNLIDTAFTLDINEFRGKRNLQLLVRDLQDPELCKKMQLGEKLELDNPKAEQEVNFSKNKPKKTSYRIGM
jgi:single-stranded-DNA-specific exonuclease